MNVTKGLADRVGELFAMANPLTYANESGLNLANSSLTHDEYEVASYSAHTITTNDLDDGPPSSPFVANVSDHSSHENDENMSPNKQLSRMTAKSSIEYESPSPLKTLKSRTSPTKAHSPQKVSEPLRSPRKLSSPEKRFPIKVSASPEKQIVVEPRALDLEDALRDSEGLKKAIEILEDEDSELNNEEHVSDDTITSLAGDDAPNMDDTMVSTFSAFSAGRYCLSSLRSK